MVCVCVCGCVVLCVCDSVLFCVSVYVWGLCVGYILLTFVVYVFVVGNVLGLCDFATLVVDMFFECGCSGVRRVFCFCSVYERLLCRVCGCVFVFCVFVDVSDVCVFCV